MADQLGRLLDPYPTAQLFVHFLSLDAPAPAHYLQHTIGNDGVSWFGAMCPLWRAIVLFLSAAKLLILLR